MKKIMLTILALAAVGSTCLFGGEATNEVKVVQIVMKCETPGCAGEMRPGNVVLTSYPPQYPHACTVCKTNRTYWVAYPQIRYEVK